MREGRDRKREWDKEEKDEDAKEERELERCKSFLSVDHDGGW